MEKLKQKLKALWVAYYGLRWQYQVLIGVVVGVVGGRMGAPWLI
jgi:hypothetical protein